LDSRFAAIAVFQQAQFFQIQSADWSVFFRLHSGHSQLSFSRQRTFAGDADSSPRQRWLSLQQSLAAGVFGQDPTFGITYFDSRLRSVG
jgi:hypothetical protein